VKIRDHVLTLTLVGLLGAFALAVVVGFLMRNLSEDTDRLSELSASTGTASEEYLTAREFLAEGERVVVTMDTLSNESSGLFRFVKDMLAEARKDLNELKKAEGFPSDLQLKLQATFEQFHKQLTEVGVQIEKIKQTPLPNKDAQVNLDAYEDAAHAFVGVMEELEDWTENLLGKHKEELHKERLKVSDHRKRAYWFMGGSGVLYLLALGYFAWRTHRILISPITRMAMALDDAIEHSRPFTKDSYTKTPWAKPEGSKKKAGPKEIQMLSRRLWQLVNGLEETVAARTKELRVQHVALLERTDSLEKEIQARQELEVELLHAQKMKSVGQLAAGIAHEIRTPTQYVGDHLLFVQEAVEKLLESASPEEDDRETIFLQENLPRAVESAMKGNDRITEIVASMKRFSYKAQQNLMQPADLNQAVLDTVAICSTEWRDCVVLEKELEPDLPEADCLLGEINQVIMNLIINAAQAVREFKKVGEMGEITIRTRSSKDDWIEIEIEDDGGGMSPDVGARIFEPFFTTKELGVGSGQGMAIAHAVIVGKHKGELTFDTQLGKGTTFKIRLPRRAESEDSQETEIHHTT
jgi:signal transduction histidine kinase